MLQLLLGLFGLTIRLCSSSIMVPSPGRVFETGDDQVTKQRMAAGLGLTKVRYVMIRVAETIRLLKLLERRMELATTLLVLLMLYLYLDRLTTEIFCQV